MIEVWLVVWVSTFARGTFAIDERKHFEIFQDEKAAIECVLGKNHARIFRGHEAELVTKEIDSYSQCPAIGGIDGGPQCKRRKGHPGRHNNHLKLKDSDSEEKLSFCAHWFD